METRFGKLTLRETDGGLTLTGCPIVYNQWSELLYGAFRERILPGAFDRFLSRKPEILACVAHDPALVLARTSTGTLTIRPEETGIAVELPVPDTSYARDLVANIRSGNVQGMSFGFDVVTDEWRLVDGVRSRDLVEAELYEVSFVTLPAYPQTSAGLRALIETGRDETLKRMESAFAAKRAFFDISLALRERE